MDRWNVTYTMTDGSVETHQVAAENADAAIDSAQPNRPGEVEVLAIQTRKIEVVEVDAPILAELDRLGLSTNREDYLDAQRPEDPTAPTEAELHEFHGGAAGSFAAEGCALCPPDEEEIAEPPFPIYADDPIRMGRDPIAVDRENDLRRALAEASAEDLEALEAVFEAARPSGKSLGEAFGGEVGRRLEAMLAEIRHGVEVRLIEEEDR